MLILINIQLPPSQDDHANICGFHSAQVSGQAAQECKGLWTRYAVAVSLPAVGAPQGQRHAKLVSDLEATAATCVVPCMAVPGEEQRTGKDLEF